jgi:hypothetical protein
MYIHVGTYYLHVVSNQKSLISFHFHRILPGTALALLIPDMVMLINIADNIMVSFPIKSVLNKDRNVFVLDRSKQPLEIIRTGQSARVVALHADRYETLVQTKIHSVTSGANGLRVRLAGQVPV